MISGVFDAIVVGAGVFGTWTARCLQDAGRRVALVEATAPGHSGSSSGGESRVARCGYGEDEIYADWARRSMVEWRALSARSRLPLFHELGVLWIHPIGDSRAEASARTLAKLEIPFERLSARDLAARYPILATTPDDAARLEPHAGALMARRAVQHLAAELVEAGVTMIPGPVAPISSAAGSGGSLDTVTLDDGTHLAAEQFIFACGPWLDRVCPDAMAGRLFTTRQELMFFAVSPRETGDLPVWADMPFYGFPSLEGRGLKVAIDTHGPATGDVDLMDRRIGPELETRVRDFLDRRIPTLADRPVTETRVCQYENSSNGDFLIDRHPGLDNVWLAGCGSGHGFKHGPAVGRHVADLVLGKAAPVARFGLACKDLVQSRSVH